MDIKLCLTLLYCSQEMSTLEWSRWLNWCPTYRMLVINTTCLQVSTLCRCCRVSAFLFASLYISYVWQQMGNNRTYQIGSHLQKQRYRQFMQTKCRENYL